MSRARLRLVDALPATALRDVAIASFRAARLAASRGRGDVLRLNHLSYAGLLLHTFGSPVRALVALDGTNGFDEQTRKYLRDVAEAEAK